MPMLPSFQLHRRFRKRGSLERRTRSLLRTGCARWPVATYTKEFVVDAAQNGSKHLRHRKTPSHVSPLHPHKAANFIFTITLFQNSHKTTKTYLEMPQTFEKTPRKPPRQSEPVFDMFQTASRACCDTHIEQSAGQSRLTIAQEEIARTKVVTEHIFVHDTTSASPE
jgi:hypothetical protein